MERNCSFSETTSVSTHNFLVLNFLFLSLSFSLHPTSSSLSMYIFLFGQGFFLEGAYFFHYYYPQSLEQWSTHSKNSINICEWIYICILPNQFTHRNRRHGTFLVAGNTQMTRKPVIHILSSVSLNTLSAKIRNIFILFSVQYLVRIN